MIPKQDISLENLSLNALNIIATCFQKANLKSLKRTSNQFVVLKGDESSRFLLFTLYGTEKNMSFLLEVFSWVNAFYNVNCVVDKNHFISSLNHFSRVLFACGKEGSVRKNRENTFIRKWLHIKVPWILFNEGRTRLGRLSGRLPRTSNLFRQSRLSRGNYEKRNLNID